MKAAFLLLTLFLAGCVKEVYKEQPLESVVTAQAFVERTAADAGLSETKEWDLSLLTQAAIKLHPDMQTARAAWRSAQAAEISAGVKPAPSASANLEHSSRIDGSSPWIFSLAFDIPIETHGKREARIEQALALSEAARLEIGKTAWSVRSRLRAKLLDGYISSQKVRQLQQEKIIRADIVALLEARLAVGFASSIEMADARLQLRRIETALASETGHLAETRAALAAAIGLPESAIDEARLSYASFERSDLALPSEDLQRAALLNRLEIRQALARYAALEAKLKLEIAKQYPDINLAPGYGWDQGANRWSLGLSLLLALLNKHNEGPIAEAKAAREFEARQFEALQASVVGEQEQALARWNAVTNEVAQLKKIVTAQQARLAQTQIQFDAGQLDRLELNLTRLELLGATANVSAAQSRVQQALGQVEDAVQQPLDGSAPLLGEEK